MILKFRNENLLQYFAQKKANSKSIAIHSQCFHQQTEVLAMICEEFMWIVGKHLVKLKKSFLESFIKKPLVKTRG